MADDATDPELRSVAGMAHATLLRIEQEAEEVQAHAGKFKLELEQVRAWTLGA